MVTLRGQTAVEGNHPFDLEEWLTLLASHYTAAECDRIKKAYHLVEKVQANTIPVAENITVLQQGISMVNTLVDLGLDAHTLIVALLILPVRQQALTMAQVEHQMGQDIVKLVESVATMAAIDTLYHPTHQKSPHPQPNLQKRTDPNQMDKLRKMLLAMVEDPRGVLIKLVEQLCLLRVAKYFSPSMQQKLADQSSDIYAPLANRLGIGQIKWEMEDLALRYRDPDTYKHIAKLLHEKRVDREDYLHQVVETLKAELAQDDIEAEVQGRVKHIYSIWRKMRRKNLDYEEIYDVRAIRILVDKLRDCYAALGTVHRLWRHIPKEFDDYIATPKGNGYQSLHTAVIGPEGKVVEVQIRTQQMHRDSELGVASHWRYKEGVRHDPIYEDKIAWLRQLISWQEQVADADDVISELREKVYEDRVYVLTRGGDVVDLPKGATPLDFAYHVHTQIGHRCRGAKVNGRIVPLTYQLATSDKIEILTGSEPHPSRDWTNPEVGYIMTSRARAKVRAWFRERDHESDQDEHASESRAPVEKEEKLLAPKIHLTEPTPYRKGDVIVQGVDNLLTHFAGCCAPIPGDNIVGYVTLGQGVSIHQQDCVNIAHIRAIRPERLVEVSWGIESQQKYPVSISITSEDRPNLLRDITQIFATERSSILAFNTALKNDIAYITLTVEIRGLERLDKILDRIQQLPNIIEVHRKK